MNKEKDPIKRQEIYRQQALEIYKWTRIKPYKIDSKPTYARTYSIPTNIAQFR